MFTRCPHCETVHALNASLLAHAGGAVRCGSCNREFSALAFLFDHFPGAEARPPAVRLHGKPPVLGQRSASSTIARPVPAPVTGQQTAVRSGPRAATLAWRLLVAALVVLTLANLAWTFRESLVSQPQLQPLLSRFDVLPEQPPSATAMPTQIHLVSRDLHLHPTQSGILVLSATFVSLADLPQPWPVISILLLDAENRPLAGRVFEPDEYLPQGLDRGLLLAANVHVPILLEFADPGDKAVGFEIEFN